MISSVNDILELVPSFYGENPKNIRALITAVKGELDLVEEAMHRISARSNVFSTHNDDLEIVFGTLFGLTVNDVQNTIPVPPTHVTNDDSKPDYYLDGQLIRLYRDIMIWIYNGTGAEPTEENIAHILTEIVGIERPGDHELSPGVTQTVNRVSINTNISDGAPDGTIDIEIAHHDEDLIKTIHSVLENYGKYVFPIGISIRNTIMDTTIPASDLTPATIPETPLNPPTDAGNITFDQDGFFGRRVW